jgi:MoaA/NifB/PqqE/SkfB family radical SAM enzyme
MEITDHAHWFLTSRCNLDCVYCFRPTFPAACDESPNRIKKLAEILVEGKIKMVTLTGGEPTLVKALPEVLEIFERAGIYVQLHTNATTLDAKRIDQLKRYLGDIAIPIDSIDSNIQKQLRGIDYLPKFWEVVKELEKQKVKFNLHTVATDLNIDGFPRLYNALKNCNFDHWKVYEFNETMVDNRFSGIERFQEVNRLNNLRGEHSIQDYRKGLTDCLLARFLLMEEKMNQKKDRRLKFVARRDRVIPYFFLDNCGDVRYCTYFTRERTVIGNLFQDGFDGIRKKFNSAVEKGPLFDEEGFIETENNQPLWIRLWLGNFWTEEVGGFDSPQNESEKGIDGRSWPKILHLYNLYRRRESRQEGKLAKSGYGALVP